MTKKAKQSTKVLQQKRRKRRQWLTFMRMVRYGVNNFTRNAWLTIAATAVMTITLLIIFLSLAAQNILADSVKSISDSVGMSIYLKTDTTREQAQPLIDELNAKSNVKSVEFIDSEEARQSDVEANKSDTKYIDAVGEAPNRLPATLRIGLEDINDTSQLDDFVANSEALKEYIDPERDPSFAGERREAIQAIGRWTVLAQRIGIVASVTFVAISSLIIFNTIRMAIFSRKEEIQMMKLIGADKQFIRGPFVVEAVVYGFIAALIASGLGTLLLIGVRDKLNESGVDVQTTLDLVATYGGFIMAGMILLGALIGTVSSLLATRRYLNI
ncbi:hypothetical protein CR983_01295 [Candidatus Saccharibacteria bacterium]|nr:MAG: hypothetical protein CR983_01295 [Candidatus Saccharibacteria bacterium]